MKEFHLIHLQRELMLHTLIKMETSSLRSLDTGLFEEDNCLELSSTLEARISRENFNSPTSVETNRSFDVLIGNPLDTNWADSISSYQLYDEEEGTSMSAVDIGRLLLIFMLSHCINQKIQTI
jgi:hypothetical protein